MGSSLEARKLAIIEYLAEVEDEVILIQIENLLQPRIDIWDELTEEEKSIIEKGVTDLKEGRRVSSVEAFKQFRKT